MGTVCFGTCTTDRPAMTARDQANFPRNLGKRNSMPATAPSKSDFEIEREFFHSTNASSHSSGPTGQTSHSESQRQKGTTDFL